MDSESILVVDSNGTKLWKNKNNQLHRIDGPAAEYSNGHNAWYQNDLLHRIDGPAVEYNDGKKLWYKNGIRFENKDKFFEALTEEEKQIALFSEDFLNG
jgi:hypothetical protein